MENHENFTNGVIISKDATIIGNGFTIDARNLGRIFNINGSNFTLTNATLANGKNIDGGAICNAGNLTINNVNLINNTAENGVAIYNKSTLTLNNNTYSGVVDGKTNIYNEGIILSPITLLF